MQLTILPLFLMICGEEMAVNFPVSNVLIICVTDLLYWRLTTVSCTGRKCSYVTKSSIVIQIIAVLLKEI